MGKEARDISHEVYDALILINRSNGKRMPHGDRLSEVWYKVAQRHPVEMGNSLADSEVEEGRRKVYFLSKAAVRLTRFEEYSRYAGGTSCLKGRVLAPAVWEKVKDVRDWETDILDVSELNPSSEAMVLAGEIYREYNRAG